ISFFIGQNQPPRRQKRKDAKSQSRKETIRWPAERLDEAVVITRLILFLRVFAPLAPLARWRLILANEMKYGKWFCSCPCLLLMAYGWRRLRRTTGFLAAGLAAEV